MKIEKLKYFIDLYENGSYTQTAKMNYISQTSVTQFINSLEAEYRVKLFNRSTIPITPTEAGKAFYKRATIIYTQYVNSLDTMKTFSENATIPINICYTSPIDLPILMPIVKKFKEEHPKIRINISKNKIKNTTHALKSFECDMVLGILTGEELDTDIKTISLYKGKYMAAVSKSDPIAKADGITASDAYTHPLILLSPEEIGDNYNIMIEFLNSIGIIPNIHSTANDIDSELFMIATENLLGFVPDIFDLNYFDDYIVKVPLLDYDCPFSLNLTYREGDNPGIPLFIDFLNRYSKNK